MAPRWWGARPSGRFDAHLVEAAARAGKAVFCEKPTAVTLSDADRAIAAADVPLLVGFSRRFNGGFAPRTSRWRADASARRSGTGR